MYCQSPLIVAHAPKRITRLIYERIRTLLLFFYQGLDVDSIPVSQVDPCLHRTSSLLYCKLGTIDCNPPPYVPCQKHSNILNLPYQLVPAHRRA